MAERLNTKFYAAYFKHGARYSLSLWPASLKELSSQLGVYLLELYFGLVVVFAAAAAAAQTMLPQLEEKPLHFSD